MDMDRVLENLNDYKDANAALEDKISFWKEEISNKQSKIDELQQKLDLERPLLTEELIEEREEDIAFEQEELNTYQQKRFGPQGDWLAQKVIFIQPIQNKILQESDASLRDKIASHSMIVVPNSICLLSSHRASH